MAATTSTWTTLPTDHKLSQFAAALPKIFADAHHSEMYGVELVAPTIEGQTPHSTLLILQKFLRANADSLDPAIAQLTAALKWRGEYNPLAARDEIFDGNKFGSLGYVVKVSGAKDTGNERDVVTWNVYGEAAGRAGQVFGDVDAFVRWRVALQELAIRELKLNEATKEIPDYGKGPDPYRAINVHDYLSVSFFRQAPEIKASSAKIIDMFQKYYPETVSYKYFVNVPIIMQWMMGAMKALMSKDSIQSMTWMTYRSNLHQYLGDDIPKEYGGKGPGLKENAITPKYVEEKPTIESTTTETHSLIDAD